MCEVLDARNAHTCNGIGEERVVGGDDEVAYPREHQAARDACAVHGRDHRLRDLPPPSAHSEVDLGLAGETLIGSRLVCVVPVQGGDVVVVRVEVTLRGADVVARREVLAVRAKHDRLDVGVVDCLAERGVERVGHHRVLGIAVLGPVQRHVGDRATRTADLVGDRRGVRAEVVGTKRGGDHGVAHAHEPNLANAWLVVSRAVPAACSGG
ncbi:Uncharacterised protein [Mycobacteroides abscessus subsp. abscessus]|nr:Uncharacterised protein [Mycobacteroides abscessus subsp. abscessus]